MSAVLVLGSNSFSGASFVRYLLDQSIDVIGASRSPEPNSVFLPYRWLSGPAQQRFRFVQLDLNHQLQELEALLRTNKVKTVVNFAAQSMVGESWDKPDDWMQTNVLSATRLAERLRHLDFLEKYVHITTPEVYGSTEGWIKEDAMFNPSTPYAVSRAAGDMIFKIYRETFGLPVVSTRAANVYGPGQPLYRIIPRTIFSLLTGRKVELHGGGVSTRSFIHIKDVSDATWRIAQHAKAGETFHISTERIIAIKDLVALLCDRLARSFSDQVTVVGERLGKDTAYWLDSAKIRAQLEWSDIVTLEAGIEETISWVSANLQTLSTLPMSYIHKS